MKDVKSILAKGYATYVIDNNNKLYVTGYNADGQLFSNNTTNLQKLTLVESNKDIMLAELTKSATSQTGLYVTTNGMVYTVGRNGYGQIGNGTTQMTTTPWCISACRIAPDKNVINLENINETEQITYKCSVGFNLLKDDMGILDCTFTSFDETIATVDEKGVVIAKGIGTTQIKLYNETNNLYSAVRINVNGEGNTTAAKIDGGRYHFISLKSNGSVYSWGDNSSGQLGTNDKINKVEPTMALAEKVLEDGTIELEEIRDAIDIGAGVYHSLVLRKDGTVWAAGANSYGQLGNGTITSSMIFRPVIINDIGDKLTNIIAITAGPESSYALCSNGYVYTWGNNSYGQLGNGSRSNQYYPVRVQKAYDIIQIDAGENYLAMLSADGSVWCCGYDGYGIFSKGKTGVYQTIPDQMLNGNTIIKGIKEIAAGANYILAIKEDNCVYGTGCNTYYQLGITSSSSNVTTLTKYLINFALLILTFSFIFVTASSICIIELNSSL